MIKILNRKIFLIFIVFAMICASVILLFFNSKSAYAMDEWRPSVELYKELDSLTAQQANLDTKYAQSLEFIAAYEAGESDFDKRIEDCQKRLDKIQVFVDQKQTEIEELTKSSYAVYFAKLLMDRIVGSTFVTDNFFHWNFVSFCASSQDKEILNLLEEYYGAQIDLNNAITEKSNSEQIYSESKNFVDNYIYIVPSITERIDKLNSLIPEVLEIENEKGTPVESRIEGNGFFCNPCPGAVIVSGVGDLRDGYAHKGIDMAIASGTPIYCAADGNVIEAGTSPTMGNFVKIQNAENFVTIYMHCSVVFVPNGVKVHRGDNIALVGSTGDSTGPHLHFQVEHNGEVVNGLDYM